jgi:methylglutaconyl-CoA hydratase
MYVNDYQTIKVEIKDRVGWITMNRPEVRNAFDERMIADIHNAVDILSADDDVRAMVVTGEGTVFSAGADIDWMKRMGQLGFEENYQDALKLAYMFDAIARSPKPSIARVNGAAIGGGTGLVSSCDVAIADHKAFFSFSEVKIGLVPGCIGPYVVRKVGQSRSRELFITGRRISAEEADRYNLINKVAEDGKLDEEIDVILKALLTSGPVAIDAAKRLVRDVPQLSRVEYIKYTANMIAELRTGPEGQEGIKAFLEKRKPEWADN